MRKIWPLVLLIILCLPFVSSTSDLVGATALYWTHDDAEISGQVMTDLAGNINAQISGAPITGVAGIKNQAIDFDGSDDYVSSSSGMTFKAITWSMNPDLTITAGANAADVLGENDSSIRLIVGPITGSVSDEALGWCPSGTCGADLWYWTFADLSVSNFTAGNWVHFIMSWNSTDSAYYLWFNGTPIGAGNEFSSPTESSSLSNVRFGRNSGGFMNAQGDEFAIFNETLDNANADTLWDGGGISQYPYQDIVTINRSSYNVTSAIQNNTLWRTNTSFPIPIIDTTPTVTFNASLASNCSIGTVNRNFTNMTTDDANRKCGTTGVTQHTCTLPATDPISASVETIYISCVASQLIQNATSTSGPLVLDVVTISITDIEVVGVTNITANITWTTDFTSNSSVNYGTTTGLGTFVDSAANVTSHNINLTGLSEATRYFYNVTSCRDGSCTTNGTFNFTTMKLVNFLLDGKAADRKYELQYVGNLTLNLSNVSGGVTAVFSFSHPDWPDVTDSSYPFTVLFNFSNLSVQTFTGGVATVLLNSTNKTATITLNNKTELGSVKYNLTGISDTGFPVNVSIFKNAVDSVLDLFGTLVGDKLEILKYVRRGETVFNSTILFERAGTQIITLSINKPKVNGTLIFNLTGSLSNQGNDLERQALLHNTSIYTDFSNSQTETFFSKLLAPVATYDDFSDSSETQGRLWLEEERLLCDSFVIYSVTPSRVYEMKLFSDTCSGQPRNLVSFSTDLDEFEVRNYSSLRFNFSTQYESVLGSNPPNAPMRIRITDGIRTVTLLTAYRSTFGDIQGDSTGPSPVEIRFIEENDVVTTAKVYYNDTLIRTQDITSLANSLDWDLKVDIESVTAPGSGVGNLYARIERGLYLSAYDIDNLTFVGPNNRTGNVTSGIIHNTSNNITSARLKWNEIILQNVSASKKFLGSAELSNSSLFSVQAWLSADNGTNWESTINNVVHVFDNPGKALRYRFIYAIRDGSGLFEPLVTGVRVFVTPENLQNFTINIDGESGDKEFNVSNLNSTELFTHSGDSVLNACNATVFQGACILFL
jgi:hypothetical protein